MTQYWTQLTLYNYLETNTINKMQNKKWIRTFSLLNFEGDVFKIVRLTPSSSGLFDIIDYYGKVIDSGLTAEGVLAYYHGLKPISTSDDITYNIANESPEAKPRLEKLLDFLGWGEELAGKDMHKVQYNLSRTQYMEYSKWIDSIKELCGEVGDLIWTIHSAGEIIKVKSVLTNQELDLTMV